MDNHNSFVRSNENKGAILNVDNEGLNNYRKQRQLLRDLGNQDLRMKKIESSIEELKDLVLKLANGR